MTHYLCSECETISASAEWCGDELTMVCPRCGFEHRDDDRSFVLEGSEMELARERREIAA